MNTIHNTLMQLGFSQHEANIYKTLLEQPGLTVYQLSKELSLSRSSIYPIVDKMFEDGFLVLQNGKKDQYYAADPAALLLQLEERFTKAVKVAKPLLTSISEKTKRDEYVNLINEEAIIAKAKAMMLATKKELVMNTDLDLELFQDEIKFLHKKGVRIVVFSFRKQPKLEGVELYSHEYTLKQGNRILLVTDAIQVLIASVNHNREEWIGTYTENRFMMKVIYEHIHHDIYLYRIKEKLGVNLFEMHPDILIDTLCERGDIFESEHHEE